MDEESSELGRIVRNDQVHDTDTAELPGSKADPSTETSEENTMFSATKPHRRQMFDSPQRTRKEGMPSLDSSFSDLGGTSASS